MPCERLGVISAEQKEGQFKHPPTNKPTFDARDKLGDVSRERGGLHHTALVYATTALHIERLDIGHWPWGRRFACKMKRESLCQGFGRRSGSRFGDGGSFCVSDWRRQMQGKFEPQRLKRNTKQETKGPCHRTTPPPPPTSGGGQITT